MTRSNRACQLIVAGMLTGGVFTAVPPAVADAAPACPKLGATQLTQSQLFTPTGGHTVEVCTGRVSSFDGTPVHVDVTLPTTAYVTPGTTTPAKSPLVVMLSGWSNDVCQFESTSFNGTAVSGCKDFISYPGYHWNNAWFASQGYVTLTYTPRGWYDSCGRTSSGYSYTSDAACKGHTFKDPDCSTAKNQQSWVHLFDRRWEVRDAQYLSGLIVDAGFVDPASHLGVDASRVITTGDSGGGGPTWDLAFSTDKVLEGCSTYSSLISEVWKSPHGVALHLAAAIPMFTWTDLVDALMNNGRASDGFHGAPADGNRLSPIGVEKQSYLSALYTIGSLYAQYAATGVDPDITTWYSDIIKGEPYNSTTLAPILSEIGGQMRSPFRIPVPTTALKPIYAIQGLTDPLFPANQTLTEFNRLKAANAAYPVWAFLGDLGHSYARNPLAVWQQAHNLSNAWLRAVLASQTPGQMPITVDTVTCESGQTLKTYVASTFGSIAASTLSFTNAAAHSTASSTATTAEGNEAGARGQFCARPLSVDSNQAIYSFAVPSAATLVAAPVVHVTAAVNLTGTTAELAARLWDVTPGVHQSLIARSVYRIQSTTGAHTLSLAFELWSNAWQLQCSHQLRLELTQDDAPTWRADTDKASTMSLTNLSLSLPVVAGAGCPKVTGVSPSSGSTAGGDTVTITGSGFTGTTAVSFGANPSASFTVDTDAQITAVSPAGSGTVDVTVTTPGATSPTGSADQFTYV